MMATISLSGLQAFVADIGLDPIPSFAAADVLNNPLDIYHSYLAGVFQAIIGCDADVVYSSIQPPGTTENGDLDIVLPKLKLPGTSPKELAGKLIEKVRLA
jgi:arginyl-tRNA synthetase